jgi:tryptophan 2,3-dioxygenase
MSDKNVVNYSRYLHLDRILSGQETLSTKLGKPAHDEMLFIIIHQVYELWFKQILHELDDVLIMFRENYVDEKNIGIANARLIRIIEIQKILIDQVRILETMTPLDFLEFRDFLTPASGFQSFQFRMIEIKLGLKQSKRISYNNQEYFHSFSVDQRQKLMEAEQNLSLFEAVEKWLERTPFLKYENFDFANFYQEVVKKMLMEERNLIIKTQSFTEVAKKIRLQMLNDNEKHFHSIFDKRHHDKLIAAGVRRFTHKASLAALFINLYRDQPILHLPYQFLEHLLDIDALFTTWRYRHSLMVLRMIGRRIGTGGSSGYEYLRTTAEKHKIFTDLFDLSTFLIPRSKLPELPVNFLRNLGFFYSQK